MDMTIFQIESNKVQPRQGSILIAAPFIQDYHFVRTVVLLISHTDEGSMGIVMNKRFGYVTTLNELVPSLEFAQRVPVYKGGPVGRDTLFYVHTIKEIREAYPLGNGLYLNGDFEQMQQYILDGRPTEGVVRFFMGYAGWDAGQLEHEIEENTWMVDNPRSVDVLDPYLHDYWQKSLTRLGGKYAVWARYPIYPILN